MRSVSAVIVVKNNPQHLFETIDSINNFVTEIIIGNIDIGNDYKKKLLQSKKVKIIDLPSAVPFADLVKEELKKKAKGEFILYLDPDEVFPTISNQQLTILLEGYDYLYFPRKNIIFAKWIQHSKWWPDYQLRLFKKDSVVWPKELHPIPSGKGKEYRFGPEEENAILHYNYDNLDQFIEKATRYAKFEADYLIQKKKNYTLSESLQKSLSEFMGRFFAHEGYKDGMHGFVLSILQMFYYFLVYFYYWEKKKYAEIDKNIGQKFQEFATNLNYETNHWLIEKKLTDTKKKIKLKTVNKVLKLLK